MRDLTGVLCRPLGFVLTARQAGEPLTSGGDSASAGA
jgi:hypothetical protein